METKKNITSYLVISGFIFGIVAVAQLLRVIYQLALQIGSINIPMSLSVIAAAIALVLSIWAFWLAKRL